MLVRNVFHFCFIISTVLAAKHRSYELTIEKVNTVMMDEQFIKIDALRINRLNRTHTVINGKGSAFVEVDNSALVTILFYEKSGTEYKKSAAVSYKDKPLCSFLESKSLGVPEFKASTNLPDKCPVPAGAYEVKNFILDPNNFPPHIPGSFWRADAILTKDDIQWMHVQVFVRIDQKNMMG